VRKPQSSETVFQSQVFANLSILLKSQSVYHLARFLCEAAAATIKGGYELSREYRIWREAENKRVEKSDSGATLLIELRES